jgi:hypothetical protein
VVVAEEKVTTVLTPTISVKVAEGQDMSGWRHRQHNVDVVAVRVTMVPTPTIFVRAVLDAAISVVSMLFIIGTR